MSIEDYIFSDVKENFKLIRPSVGADIDLLKKTLLDEYESLCRKKYEFYEEYYGVDNETLLKKTAMLGGEMGGVTRRMRTACIVSLLESLKANNSKGFKRFSVTCFRELSKYLFNVAPSRENLLALANSGYGRITTNGLNIDYAIAYLCSQDDDAVSVVKACYDDYMKHYKDDLELIKKASDEKIIRYKETIRYLI